MNSYRMLVKAAVAQSTMGALNRSPIVVRAPRKKLPIKPRFAEADRGADGKLVSGVHSAQAREHMLAASIAMNSGDHDEAVRRIDSATIHTSHSPHKAAPQVLTMLQDALVLLKNGNAEKAAAKVDAAYAALQGEPNKLLQMKKTRESDAKKNGRLIETLTFHPKFLEGTYDPVAKTVDVIIITEGMGNSRDKHYYTAEAIQDAVKNKVFESEQAYADHPSKFDDDNRPERSVRDLIGYYFDSKLTEAKDKRTGKLVPAYGAKFKIQEGLDWVVGIVKEAIAFNKKFPDKTYVGISINADGDTVPGEMDGVGDVNKVVRITEAFSADMVTKPARGGGFLKLVEGAGGASRSQSGGVHMKGILDAAARLKELAGGAEVDPAALVALAESLIESDKKLGEAAGDVDDLSKKGSSNNKVGLDQMSESEKAEYDKLGESDKPAYLEAWQTKNKSKSDPQNKTADDDDDNDMTEAQKAEAKRVKESEAAKRRSLIESLTADDLKKQFPSLHAAALKEAQSAVGDDLATLKRRNAQLEAEAAMRESVALATKKLKESNIPASGAKYALNQCIGHTPEEMDSIIEGISSMLESTDSRISGNGERKIAMRESQGDNTALVLAGLTEE